MDASFTSTKEVYNIHPHSEVAVPIDSCMQLLDGVRDEANRLGVAYSIAIKVVPPSKAWRTWAVHKSCSINFDFYDFGHDDSVDRDLRFRAFTEELAVDRLGGGLHLGKMWVRSNRQQLLRNAPRVADFERLRQQLDPTGTFQNEHTRSSHGDGECYASPVPNDLDARSRVWRFFVWFGVATSILLSIASCATCMTAYRHSRRLEVERRLVSAKPAHSDASGDSLPLLNVTTY